MTRSTRTRSVNKAALTSQRPLDPNDIPDTLTTRFERQSWKYWATELQGILTGINALTLELLVDDLAFIRELRPYVNRLYRNVAKYGREDDRRELDVILMCRRNAIKRIEEAFADFGLSGGEGKANIDAMLIENPLVFGAENKRLRRRAPIRWAR